MRGFLLGVVILCLAASAVAQAPAGKMSGNKQAAKAPSVEPAPQRWEAEPSTVAGIALGELMEKSGLPTCERKRDGRPVDGGPMCVYVGQGLESHPQVMNTPIDRDFFIDLVDGRVAVVMFKFPQDSMDDIQSMLSSKYGAPMTATTEKVQTRAGGVFDSRRLEWMGKSTVLTVVQRHGEIGWGAVIFGHIPTLKAMHDLNQRQLEETGKGL